MTKLCLFVVALACFFANVEAGWVSSSRRSRSRRGSSLLGHLTGHQNRACRDRAHCCWSWKTGCRGPSYCWSWRTGCYWLSCCWSCCWSWACRDRAHCCWSWRTGCCRPSCCWSWRTGCCWPSCCWTSCYLRLRKWRWPGPLRHTSNWSRLHWSLPCTTDETGVCPDGTSPRGSQTEANP